jgi:hypothetical protein
MSEYQGAVVTKPEQRPPFQVENVIYGFMDAAKRRSGLKIFMLR